MDADTERERIVQAATRLFAALGFDATTTELIADSAGVGAAAVRRAFPGNVDIYREVMRRASAAEQRALAGAVAAFTPTQQGMERILDDYLDFYAEHPELLGLWLHRRTGDATDTADLDDSIARPKLAWIANALRDAVPDPAHLDYMLWTFPWVVSGFLGHGLVHADGSGERRDGRRVSGPELEAFRGYLHLLTRRLLALPDAPAS